LANIRDRDKNFAPSGVIWFAQFNGVIEIYPRLTFVAMAMKICEFWCKIS